MRSVRKSSESPHCRAEKRRMSEVLGAKSPPGGLPGQAPEPQSPDPWLGPPCDDKREKTESQAPFQALPGARCPRWELVPPNPNDPATPTPGQLLGQERAPGWTGRGGGGHSPSGGQAARSPQTREAHGAWASLRRPRGLPLPWRECGGASRAEETSPVRHSQLRACVPASPAAPEGPLTSRALGLP